MGRKFVFFKGLQITPFSFIAKMDYLEKGFFHK